MAEAWGGAMMKMSNPKAEELMEEIRSTVPWGDVWLKSPHALLGGESPEQKIMVKIYLTDINVVESAACNRSVCPAI
jgi:hypothetical protein